MSIFATTAAASPAFALVQAPSYADLFPELSFAEDASAADAGSLDVTLPALGTLLLDEFNLDSVYEVTPPGTPPMLEDSVSAIDPSLLWPEHVQQSLGCYVPPSSPVFGAVSHEAAAAPAAAPAPVAAPAMPVSAPATPVATEAPVYKPVVRRPAARPQAQPQAQAQAQNEEPEREQHRTTRKCAGCGLEKKRVYRYLGASEPFCNACNQHWRRHVHECVICTKLRSIGANPDLRGADILLYQGNHKSRAKKDTAGANRRALKGVGAAGAAPATAMVAASPRAQKVAASPYRPVVKAKETVVVSPPAPCAINGPLA